MLGNPEVLKRPVPIGAENMRDEGGLAQVTTTRNENGSCSVRLDNIRLLDVIDTGSCRVVEYKGRNKFPIQARLEEVISALDKLLPCTK